MNGRRSMMRSGFAVVGAVALVLLTSACGGTTKAEYERQVRDVARDVDKSVAGDAAASDSQQLARARKSLEKAIDRMEGIDPPERVEKAHEQYIDGLEGMAKLMGRYENLDPQKPADQARVVKLFEELEGDDSPIGKIERAQRSFEKAGYDLFPEAQTQAAK